MRTIKCRGFNAKNGQWLFGFYLQNRGGHFVSLMNLPTEKAGRITR